jgi:hypothetical protein
MRWTVPKFGGPWPTARQEFLLQAALGHGDDTHRALARWEPGFDPQRIDHETLTLLPLLYRTLQAERIPSPFMDRYRSVYRWSWYRNQFLFGGARRALSHLHRAGIATMLVKGAALSRFGYGDDGARAMGDCDVLVPPSAALDAGAVLADAGFAADVPLSRAIVQSRHSVAFRDAQGRDVDLHWHALIEDVGPGADDSFWASSLAVDWEGIATRVPCPADHLLVMVAHGAMGARNISPIYWIADAAVLARGNGGGAVAWDRLAEQARERRLALTVRRALDYLAATFDVPVPAETRVALGAPTPTVGERLEYKLKIPNAARSPLGNLPREWFIYARRCRRRGERPAPVAFLRFLRDRRPGSASRFASRALAWPARQAGRIVASLVRDGLERARAAAPDAPSTPQNVPRPDP